MNEPEQNDLREISAFLPRALQGELRERYGDASEFTINPNYQQGSHGSVYAIENKKRGLHLAVKVAIISSDETRKIYRRQFDLLFDKKNNARVSHLNIVSLLAVQDTGMPMLLMEHGGKDITTYLKFWGHPQVTAMTSAICFGLEYLATVQTPEHPADKVGLVHQDIKPLNILYDEQSKTFKLTDFDALRTISMRKESSGPKRTFMYRAPESANSPPAQSMDVYSLSMVLLEVLGRGEPFFVKEASHGSGDVDIEAYDKLRRNPENIRKALSGTQKPIPSPFHPIILKGLSAKPTDRHQTIREFREAVEAAGRSAQAIDEYIGMDQEFRRLLSGMPKKHDVTTPEAVQALLGKAQAIYAHMKAYNIFTGHEIDNSQRELSALVTGAATADASRIVPMIEQGNLPSPLKDDLIAAGKAWIDYMHSLSGLPGLDRGV